MTAYLTMPIVPTVVGFDPRLQFVHEDDAVEVSRRAVLQRTSGTFNVAGHGTVLLSQVLRMLGRPVMPMPAAMVPVVGRSLSRGSWADFSRDQIRYLRSGRVLDTSAIGDELGFTGRYSTRQALEAFAEAVHRG
jgi:UDP-glucose 4-epimerase